MRQMQNSTYIFQKQAVGANLHVLTWREGLHLWLIREEKNGVGRNVHLQLYCKTLKRGNYRGCYIGGN